MSFFNKSVIKNVFFKGRQKQKVLSRKKRATVFPTSRNIADLEQFFTREIKFGDEALAEGDVEDGVEHFALAVSICGEPNNLLGVLQKTLEPHVFQLLLEKIPLAGIRMMSFLK